MFEFRVKVKLIIIVIWNSNLFVIEIFNLIVIKILNLIVIRIMSNSILSEIYSSGGIFS